MVNEGINQVQQPIAAQPAVPPPPTHTTVIVRDAQVAPSNYMVQAILVTIFCCLPFGIVAIVKATEVNSRFATGDVVGAQESSRSAKKWATIGLITGIILNLAWIIFVIVYYVVILAAFSRSF
ncbi:proline rich transmembrane protein 1B-like isoform X1 [Diadema setosum]|uniref:proline rich transmembrane protein 1B-like isoform X1 n=1 Tax=Diadema setosum TaxID=31175 RepID=UPI003B3B3178